MAKFNQVLEAKALAGAHLISHSLYLCGFWFWRRAEVHAVWQLPER